jgi:hypothetical protein
MTHMGFSFSSLSFSGAHKNFLLRGVALGMAGLLGGGLARAQWLTQELPLRAGWNAVFLRVEPEASACDDLFAGLPVAGVWRWNGSDRTLQFTESPNRLLPPDDDWLVWLPPGHPQAGLSTLHALHANTACLVKVANGTAPFVWRVKGRPRLFRPEWRVRGLNFTGLPVPESGATFAGFFRACPAVALTRAAGGAIQMVQSDGRGAPVWTPARTRIEPGRAYWIYSLRSSDFSGPLRVETDFGNSLVFAAGKGERSVTIRNVTDHPLTVTVRLRPSEPQPPDAQYAALVGPAPLSVVEKDWSQGRPRTVYAPFAEPRRRTLAAGEEWTLKLALRQRELRADGPDTVRLNLLEISDGENFRDVVGIIARGDAE